MSNTNVVAMPFRRVAFRKVPVSYFGNTKLFQPDFIELHAESLLEVINNAAETGVLYFTRDDLILNSRVFPRVATITRYNYVCSSLRYLIAAGLLTEISRNEICLLQAESQIEALKTWMYDMQPKLARMAYDHCWQNCKTDLDCRIDFNTYFSAMATVVSQMGKVFSTSTIRALSRNAISRLLREDLLRQEHDDYRMMYIPIAGKQTKEVKSAQA